MSENKLALIDEIKKRIGSADFSDHVERRAYEIALAGLEQEPKHKAAVATLEGKGYTWHGGQLWKPPLGKAPTYITGEQPPLVLPEPAMLTNIDQICPLDVNLSQTDFATGWNECRQFAITNNAMPPVVKGISAKCQGWNACRRAMVTQPETDNTAQQVEALAMSPRDYELQALVNALRVPSKAISDVIAERQRQVTDEGYTPERDEIYVDCELASAAACYAIFANQQGFSTPAHWPWGAQWWKQTNQRRDLVKAGALILAEIERLDRLNHKAAN